MSLDQVKTDVEELKRTTTTVLSAIGDNAKATRENTTIVNEMLISMRERDVRDEYRMKEIQAIGNKADTTANNLNEYKERHRESLVKLERSQANWAGFWVSVNSTWGKMFGVAIIIAFALAIEIDLSKLLGK